MADDLAGCPRSSVKTLWLRWFRPFRPNAAPGPDHALGESAAAETLDKRGANFEGGAAPQQYLGGHLRSSGLPRHQGPAPASWPRRVGCVRCMKAFMAKSAKFGLSIWAQNSRSESCSLKVVQCAPWSAAGTGRHSLKRHRCGSPSASWSAVLFSFPVPLPACDGRGSWACNRSCDFTAHMCTRMILCT